MRDFTELDHHPLDKPVDRKTRKAVLDLLKVPHTVIELCRVTGLSKPAVGYHLIMLTAKGPLRRAHICDWRIGVTGPHTAVYLAGDLPDAPKRQRRARQSSVISDRSRAIDFDVQSVIADRMLSRAQIERATGFSTGQVQCAIARLKAKRKIHVGGFLPQGRGMGRRTKVPMFQLGDKPDAVYQPATPARSKGDLILEADNATKAAQMVEAATAKKNTWFGALV